MSDFALDQFGRGQSVLAARTASLQILFGFAPVPTADAPADRMEEVLESLGPAGLRAILWCQQVHGAVLASVSEEPGAGLEGVSCVGRCDGIVSDLHGVGLLVWTADCVPVLISGGGVVAAAHAGWRGCAAGIVVKAIRRFVVEYGVSPEQLTVFLGPSVNQCHYQVGTEVIDRLSEWGVPENLWLEGERVDLRPFLHGQVQGAGVPESSITTVGPCTACDARFASYRRDGERAGRQWSMIFRCG